MQKIERKVTISEAIEALETLQLFESQQPEKESSAETSMYLIKYRREMEDRKTRILGDQVQRKITLFFNTLEPCQ